MRSGVLRSWFPIIAGSWVALTWPAGCADTVAHGDDPTFDSPTIDWRPVPTDGQGESPRDPVAPQPDDDTADLTSGSWFSILEGSSGQFVSWYTFREPDRLSVAQEHRPYWDTEPTIESRDEGRFSVEAEGVVAFEWNRADGFTHTVRATFGVVGGDWWGRFDRPELGRTWYDRVYRRNGEEPRVFRHERLTSIRSTDHIVLHHHIAVDLTFDAPLDEIEPGASCAVVIDITVENDILDELHSGHESFHLDCLVANDDLTGLRAIWIGGLEPREQRQLRAEWTRRLDELDFLGRYPDRIYLLFAESFEPLLYWDPGRPEVLYHHPHSWSSNGLTWSEQGSPGGPASSTP